VLVPDSYDPDGFRAKYGITKPYVLFAGRREGGKGWSDLLRAFTRAVVRLGVDLELVSFGVGEVILPAEIASRVKDLGFLPQEDVGNAYAAAAAYIQPSLYESFSRTIMESWLAGTPVIANRACEVVRWHCERSGGGLLYTDDYELAQYLALVAAAGDGRPLRHLGDRGRDYVRANYTWEAALDRMEAALEEMP
jgi:glycosyltransferase involved in cell wall biosynthesis